MREIVLDTETTGIHVYEGHRIIEIGAVELVDRYRTGKHFHTFVNPKRDVSEGAYKVHGISSDFLRDKPVFAQVVVKFLEFIGDSKLIIHNAPFDIGFLNHHMAEIGLPALESFRVIDTLDMARKKYPGAKNNLDALCARLNIDTSARVHHGALLDSELLADCYLEMTGAGSNQRNLLFTSRTEEVVVQTEKVVMASNKFVEAREFPPSAEELAEHEAFLGSLKNPLWKVIAS